MKETAIEDFVNMMKTAYDMEGTQKTAFAEKDIRTVHTESGIKIHGFPDKVIQNSDGTYTVIDYKTGRRIKHFVDDPASMLQATLYSYIVQKEKHKTVSSFEYKYIRLTQSVASNTTGMSMENHYAELNEIMLQLKACLDTGKFETATDNNVCKYCTFKDICLKQKK